MKLAKSDQGVISSADLIVSGVPVYGATRLTSPADAIAIKEGRVHEVGRQDTINRYKGADTKIIQPQKGCVIPGLIDGHAHMDREGLKKILPSLDGAESKGDISLKIPMKINGLYPNPSNGRFQIGLVNFPGGESTIRVFNILGQEIRSFDFQKLLPGRHFLDLDLNKLGGRPFGSGMVFIRVETEKEQVVKKCVLLKN